MRRLDARSNTQRTWTDGRRTADFVGEFIKPNDRLTALERLEIYNRQYWFRIIDCLYDDYPGLQAVLGKPKFNRLVLEYLDRNPSRSYTLRNLGSRLASFLIEHPDLIQPRGELAIEMAQFEWAQVVGFDGEAKPAVSIDDLLGANPAKLRLSLQPYITLLELHWPLDDWTIALKKASSTLRSEASNAVETSAETSAAKSKARPKLPKKQTVFVAVHRYEGSLYYKRLEPEAFRMLARLRDGESLESACAGVPEDFADQVQKWFSTWTTMGWFWRWK
jgi:hypothetical protein